MAGDKRSVLFLCTGNSCRSHMAEGWLRHLAGDEMESLSAGADPAGYVHPLAIEVMKEVGVDISSHTSKSIQDFIPNPPNVIVSVCDSAAENCPIFPGAVNKVAWPFDDPAHAEGTDEEKLNFFRRVRDEIKDKITSGMDDLRG